MTKALNVVASPASFNNRAGLARTINEHLAPGTDVLVAEMGTYGPGEIRDMCRFVPPDIAAITAIGPVHLERMRSEDRITEAKSEIFERASVAGHGFENMADRVGALSGTVQVVSSPGAGTSVRGRIPAVLLPVPSAPTMPSPSAPVATTGS